MKNLFYNCKYFYHEKYYQIKKNLIIPSIFSKNIIDIELQISAYTNISTSYPMMYHTLM